MNPTLLLVPALLAPAMRAAAQAPTAVELETFEREVRPLLLRRCSKCHGAEEQESDLRTDHITFLLRGGSRGPALVPGDPSASRVIAAVSYSDPDLQMPPKGRLTEEEVEILRRWIVRGAPWPDEQEPEAGGPAAEFDLEQRRREHWAWQPLLDPQPPAVGDADWCLDPIDNFVLRRLEERGLRPAPDADRATWLRRVTFDLTGLPPTAAEVEAFLADEAEGAHARVVDRLLASPHFGERWARHWLDLVRYAETMGHEYDFEIPNAWRYRDYVIRAFNADVPYHDFAIEHIAGDLLPEPRLDPATGDNESVVATGSFWFCEQTHSPVDVYHHLADRVDNQLDVMGKTFLGLTVGCARCHDHKFDAISAADYYSLFGFLDSSRYAQVQVSQPMLGTPAEAAMRVAMSAGALAARESLSGSAGSLRSLLAAAVALRSGDAETLTPERVQAEAAEAGVDTERLQRWLDVLGDEKVARNEGHPLRALAVLAAAPTEQWPDVWAGLITGRETRHDGDGDEVLADFDLQDTFDWFRDGDAFATGPLRGPLVLPDGKGLPRLVDLPGGWAHSGGLGPRRQGVLHSPSFTLDRPYLHVLVAGRGSRINLVNEGFHLIRNPIYGGLQKLVENERPHWVTFDVGMWSGNRAWLALVDQTTPDLADPEHENGYPEDAWLAVQHIVLSDSKRPPATAHCVPAELLGRAPLEGPDDLVERYVEAFTSALADPDPVRTDYLARLQRRDLVPPPAGPELEAALAALDAYDAAPVRTAPATVDGTGIDRCVFVRGNPHDRGIATPRRFLQALDGPEPMELPPGSGRLQLARAMFAPDNPLPSRVMANRIWHHLTGRGIAGTVDNLGHLGEPPTHPELLDWLARQLARDDWSVKTLIRRVVLSRTYRMSSRVDHAAAESDPDNVWLHRMRVRRLEAEAIRDAVLAISGRLDRTLFGPPVPIHLTRFMTGRGRPGDSGPLDGDGRRSIYQAVRRNFLNPTMLAFDLPTPFGTVGRRGRSNVPAQALAMMNDPFVVEQCATWAEGLLAQHEDQEVRLRAMYVAALARPPSAEEEAASLEFLAGQAETHSCDLDDPRPWADLGHVLLNLPEFLFLP